MVGVRDIILTERKTTEEGDCQLRKIKNGKRMSEVLVVNFNQQMHHKAVHTRGALLIVIVVHAEMIYLLLNPPLKAAKTCPTEVFKINQLCKTLTKKEEQKEEKISHYLLQIRIKTNTGKEIEEKKGNGREMEGEGRREEEVGNLTQVINRNIKCRIKSPHHVKDREETMVNKEQEGKQQERGVMKERDLGKCMAKQEKVQLLLLDSNL